MDALTATLLHDLRREVTTARGCLARYQLLAHEDPTLKTAVEELGEALNTLAALERRILGVT